MFNRDLYLNKLIGFKDTNLIKVVTGIRRCGKSSLLLLFKEYLGSCGIKDDNIISINFESLKYDYIEDYKILYEVIEKNVKKTSGRVYILLDEVQLVSEWEKAINSFMVDFDCDIYITGSNAFLLSSELSTLLSGRYVNIQMLPLSFKEYLDFNKFKKLSVDENFINYLKYGGLPVISELSTKENLITQYLRDIYNTVIMKDVIGRNKITDIALLNNLFSFVASNTGNIISPNKISDYLKSNNKTICRDTIDNYLLYLEKAFIIYKVPRYDIKGKLLLKTLAKYYVVDTGIRNAVIGYRDSDYGQVLENIVYFELLRRDYNVYVGKNDNNEIDFIAEKENDKKYYQVTYSLTPDVIERETRSLEIPNNSYEKIIISNDKNYIKDIKGIKLLNIIDFLLEE
ncbi:MAG: ATP-binding protein [Bacilli bacterium]